MTNALGAVFERKLSISQIYQPPPLIARIFLSAGTVIAVQYWSSQWCALSSCTVGNICQLWCRRQPISSFSNTCALDEMVSLIAELTRCGCFLSVLQNEHDVLQSLTGPGFASYLVQQHVF